MTREEIVAIAAEDADVSKAKAAAVLSSVLESITDALSEGDKVTFVGFGTFSTSERAARTGRNPQTGATIQIPATTVPKFKAGKKLKDAV
ncbi:MAG: HU family DNA-binding protein [Candidatus Latescibacteria bacterium]|nr:HU family DNA-binding protein [Candidatus Latescibacterota bacterium]MCK5328300.1 HU family DNA-binding protein [Candidatus Latescibacterota bacterium]MCK5380810.1 HU family DNA-binding protein [Candidatus Latescibacterota bacterium]MCK5526030.1 HU family DNA-binding protein [Candidatus Latescibacterota bacterium]